MTDNVAITAGAGTTIATDDIGGAHHQFVKIRDATLDSVNGLVIDASGRITAVIATLPALPAGSNNIGDVDLASAIPAGSNLIGQVDLNSVPGAASTTDAVAAVAATDAIVNNSAAGGGFTRLVPKFAKIVASASGATQIVAAVTSKKLRVLSLAVVANAAVNVKFQSQVTPTDLTGLHYLAANGGFVLPFNPIGWFETIAGERLDINLSAAVAVGGSISYVEV